MHGTSTGMAKKNRLIKSRSPGGRPSRAGQEREFPPAQVKRLRDAAMAGLRDPEWGTELGRLYLEGTITHGMYAAGKKWGEYADKYSHAIGVFPVRSSTGEPRGKAHPPDPDSKKGKDIAEKEADHAERFFEAHSVLVRAGAMVGPSVRRLCEHNEGPCGMAELIAVRTGLMALVSHWNLTTMAKSAYAADR